MKTNEHKRTIDPGKLAFIRARYEATQARRKAGLIAKRTNGNGYRPYWQWSDFEGTISLPSVQEEV